MLRITNDASSHAVVPSANRQRLTSIKRLPLPTAVASMHLCLQKNNIHKKTLGEGVLHSFNQQSVLRVFSRGGEGLWRSNGATDGAYVRAETRVRIFLPCFQVPRVGEKGVCMKTLPAVLLCASMLSA
ncbi:MAG: hypothetical protein P8Y95_14045, partial [Gammaproteobacteria bacterium]